jgi:hypothetical protein
MHKLKVLVLEDDVRTLRFILAVLDELGDEHKLDIAATILPDYIQVEQFINKNPHIKFDLLLLDRDCYLGGSFHVVDLHLFDINKIISISSVFEYNQEAVKLGVKRVVFKSYEDLPDFKDRLKKEVAKLL